MNAASLGHALRRANHLPSICLWILCLPSLQDQHKAFWTISQPSLLTINTLSFKPHCSPEVTKFRPTFQASHYGDSFTLCTLLCVSLSLARFCNCGSLPTAAATVCFSPKPHLHTLYLLSCGPFFTFSWGVCSARLQVNFWGIYDDFIII